MKSYETSTYEAIASEIRSILSTQTDGFRLAVLMSDDGCYELAESIEGAESWSINPDEEYTLDEAVECLGETVCEYLDECYGVLVDTGMV